MPSWSSKAKLTVGTLLFVLSLCSSLLLQQMGPEMDNAPERFVDPGSPVVSGLKKQ